MRQVWLNCVALALAYVVLASPGHAQSTAPPATGVAVGVSLQGRIVRMQAPDQFIVRTRDGRDVTFYTGTSTRYLYNDRPIRYSDLRVGSDITAAYTMEGDRYMASSVTVGGNC